MENLYSRGDCSVPLGHKKRTEVDVELLSNFASVGDTPRVKYNVRTNEHVTTEKGYKHPGLQSNEETATRWGKGVFL